VTNLTSVTELNAANGSLVRVIEATKDEMRYPQEIAISGSHVWITDASSNAVTELNESNGTLIRVIM
jgi:hypothetical protein